MNFPNALYLGLLFLSFILSFKSLKYDKSMRIFPLLLFLSLTTEAIVYLMFFALEKKPQFYVIYHIYILIEYSLLCYFFQLNTKNSSLRKIIKYSIPLFIITSTAISIFTGYYIYPGHNLNLAGFLIIIWTTITLFNIEPQENLSLFHLPLFWISIGVLTYYSGSFFFNGVYQYFIENNSELAKGLNGWINKGLNYVLYTCFSIAFICTKHRK